MQPLRLNELPTRVVAWHNRHPLARRIQVSQVHSIGEVLLPFASARPLGVGLPAAAPAAAVMPRSGASLAELVSARAAARPLPVAALPGLSLPSARSAEPDVVPDDRAGFEPVAAQYDEPALAAQALVGWLHRLAAQLTGRRPGWPRLAAVFSRDFIWPLTPRQVARWAQRHGQPQTLAPADWPRRVVDADPARLGRLRQAGLPHGVQLHLLTAAIGVGDRRIRLLIDGEGRILGPRAYSRPRSTAAAGLLLAGLVAAGWPWGGLTPGGELDAPAVVAQTAVVARAAAASGASADVLVSSTAVAPAEVEPAPPSAEARTDTASIPSRPDQTDRPRLGTTEAGPSKPAPDQTPATWPTPSDAVATTAPLGRIRPSLSDHDKHLARQQAAQLRAAPVAVASATSGTAGTPPATAGPSPAPVYAVVSRPTRQRETAASGLALMRAAGAQLSAPVPDQGELMQSQGQWRAAWWPFASQVDAERARVLLAGRGLKAEVVEF